MSDKMREAFETAIVQVAEKRQYRYMDSVLERDTLGDYATTWVDSAWIGYQIALTQQPESDRPWTELAACLYQACGAYDLPERILDVLSLAQRGEPFAHLIDGLLPCCPQPAQVPEEGWREAMTDLIRGKGCNFDTLNPCYIGRPDDVVGRHWGGGRACEICTAKGLLAAPFIAEKREGESGTVKFELYQGRQGFSLCLADESGGHRLSGPKVTGASLYGVFEVDYAELCREAKNYLCRPEPPEPQP